MVSVNPMYKARELEEILDGLGRHGASSRSTRSTARSRAEVVGDSDVRAVVTTSPLDFVERRPARGCSPASSARATTARTTCSSSPARTTGETPEPVEPRPRRRRVPHLHVGHDRPAQGRDEHPPQRRLQRAGLPRLDPPRRGRQRLRRRAAVPHHRADRPRRRRDARADAARARSTASTPASRSRRSSATARRSRSPRSPRSSRSCNHPDGDGRDLSSLDEGLQRRRADPVRDGRDVRGEVRAPTSTTSTGSPRRRRRRTPSRSTAARRSTRAPARCRSACRCSTRSCGSSARTARSCRPARSASSSRAARRSCPATGRSPRRPRTRCPAAR